MTGLLTRITRRETVRKVKGPTCLVCGKSCDAVKDKNSDGTHAHYNCLRANQAPIPPRKERKS